MQNLLMTCLLDWILETGWKQSGIASSSGWSTKHPGHVRSCVRLPASKNLGSQDSIEWLVDSATLDRVSLLSRVPRWISFLLLLLFVIVFHFPSLREGLLDRVHEMRNNKEINMWILIPGPLFFRWCFAVFAQLSENRIFHRINKSPYFRVCESSELTVRLSVQNDEKYINANLGLNSRVRKSNMLIMQS